MRAEEVRTSIPLDPVAVVLEQKVGDLDGQDEVSARRELEDAEAGVDARPDEVHREVNAYLGAVQRRLIHRLRVELRSVIDDLHGAGDRNTTVRRRDGRQE